MNETMAAWKRAVSNISTGSVTGQRHKAAKARHRADDATLDRLPFDFRLHQLLGRSIWPFTARDFQTLDQVLSVRLDKAFDPSSAKNISDDGQHGKDGDGQNQAKQRNPPQPVEERFHQPRNPPNHSPRTKAGSPASNVIAIYNTDIHQSCSRPIETNSKDYRGIGREPAAYARHQKQAPRRIKHIGETGKHSDEETAQSIGRETSPMAAPATTWPRAA